MNLKPIGVWLGCFALGLASAAGRADSVPATQPGTQPATRPADIKSEGEGSGLEPGGAAAQISADAQAELDQMKQAYQSLKSLEMNGTIAVDFQVMGQNQKQTTSFTTSYHAPNEFKHEVKDNVLVGSTGQKAYAYLPGQKQYLQADAPQERVNASDWPRFVVGILQQQNPSLLLALSKDPAGQLVQGATKLEKSADQQIGDKSYVVLTASTPMGEQHFAVDPKTHLLRQATFDLRQMFESRGVAAADVKSAQVRFDYERVARDGAVQAGQFAWTPPSDAKDVAEAAGQDHPAVAELEGKPAPDLALPDLAGKTVKLADQKGSVVVLDFWATWCPPCVKGMPILDKVYKEKAGQGLKVFAVNVGEPKEKVKGFLEQNKLSLPVLLDESNEVSQKYRAEAIPQTVIIGKDGVVKKVLVGLHSEEQLKQEISKAMAN